MSATHAPSDDLPLPGDFPDRFRLEVKTPLYCAFCRVTVVSQTAHRIRLRLRQ